MTLFITVRNVARSRAFYSDILGGTVVLEENPCMVKLANSWIIMNPGGGPTRDKPGISVVNWRNVPCRAHCAVPLTVHLAVIGMTDESSMPSLAEVGDYSEVGGTEDPGGCLADGGDAVDGEVGVDAGGVLPVVLRGEAQVDVHGGVAFDLYVPSGV
jgi:hypothetical protein